VLFAKINFTLQLFLLLLQKCLTPYSIIS